MNAMRLAERLTAVIQAAGVPILGISIGTPADKATWRVSPPSLQADAQATIDAFDPTDPSHTAAEHAAAIARQLDTERALSAVIWTVIDTYSPPATKAKYAAARTKVINAYQAQPWQ